MSTLLAQVDDLHARHEQHAAVYYRRAGGQPTGEAANYATMRARFRAHCLSEVQQAQLAGRPPLATITKGLVAGWLAAMAQEGLTRTYINQSLRRFRTMLRWAASMELVPDELVNSVRLVQPLRAHRSGAREAGPKRPPSGAVLEAIMAELGPELADVCKTLSLTAARPGEVLSLTTAEVEINPDGTGRITKASHKTAYRGKSRIIPLSREAVAVLEPRLRPLVKDLPIFPGRGSRAGHITTDTLRKAMARACRRIAAPLVRPYDIRRSSARAVRAACGLDAAQALLGHSNAATTEIYAPIDTAEGPTLQLATRATDALAHQSRRGGSTSSTTSPQPAISRPQALGGVG